MVWEIWGTDWETGEDLEPVFVECGSFDEAIDFARKINKWYSAGRVSTDGKE